MKPCTKCKKEQPLSEYHKAPNTKDGHRSQCKICLNEYRLTNAERIKRKKQEWYKNNAEYVAKAKKTYRDSNKESIAATKKQWCLNNPEKVRASYIRKLNKIRKDKLPNLWALNNPEKVAIIKKNYKHRRRVKEKEGSVSTSGLNNWLATMPKFCEYCGTSCLNNYHIDHIDPLSKNGKHELSNLAIACPSCNLQKSNRKLVQWLAIKTLEIKDKKP